MARQFGWICLALGLFMMSAQTSPAQMRIGHQFPQRAFRALGHGNGPGHHHCNPGPDVSYYNSWSQKNSFLVSQSPQYLSRYGHETERSPMQLLHSGQSPYAPSTPIGGFYGNTVPMNADFVPSKPMPNATEANSYKNELRADDEESVESNSAKDGLEANDESKAEDRFETEAEQLEKESESRESRSDKAHGPDTAFLATPSVFLPVRNPVYGSGK